MLENQYCNIIWSCHTITWSYRNIIFHVTIINNHITILYDHITSLDDHIKILYDHIIISGHEIIRSLHQMKAQGHQASFEGTPTQPQATQRQTFFSEFEILINWRSWFFEPLQRTVVGSGGSLSWLGPDRVFSCPGLAGLACLALACHEWTWLVAASFIGFVLSCPGLPGSACPVFAWRSLLLPWLVSACPDLQVTC